MRYHYEKPFLYFNEYRNTYECNHPVYNRCTLIEIGEKGLAIIQQRYDSNKKKILGGARLILGLPMSYIYIQNLKNTSIIDLANQ